MKLTINSNFQFRVRAIEYAPDGNITLSIDADNATDGGIYQYRTDLSEQCAREKVPVSLVQYASDFTESHPVKEKTRSSYLLMLRHLRTYGDTEMEKISTAYLQNFIAYMESQGLGRRTVRLYFQKLACVLHHAYKNNLFDDRILQRVQRPQKPKDRKCFLTEQEVRRLYDTEVPENQEGIRQMFLFSCFSGLRFCDVTTLKWSSVKRVNNRMYLDFRQTKTGVDEVLPLCSQAEEILRARGRKGAYVFDSVYQQKANQSIRKWCKAARIKKPVTYHTSRHTFCVMLLSHDVPIFTVQRLMGHTEISTTETYADLLNKTKSKALKKLPVFTGR